MFTSFRTFLCLPFSYGLFYLIGFVSYFLLPSLPFPKLLPGCVSRPLLTLVVVSSGHSSTNHSLMTLSGRQSPSGEILFSGSFHCDSRYISLFCILALWKNTHHRFLSLSLLRSAVPSLSADSCLGCRSSVRLRAD